MNYKKGMLPKAKPQNPYQTVVKNLNKSLKKFQHSEWDKNELILFLCVGYYRDSMGVKGVNDRRIFDDAMFVLSNTCFQSFNCNADPNGRRPGRGFGRGKGMGNIANGVWRDSWRIGTHRGSYPALVQAEKIDIWRDAFDANKEFTVDGIPRYLEKGNRYGGFNMHWAGSTSTSSLGCITFPFSKQSYKNQWRQFIELVQNEMKRKGVKRATLVKNHVQG